MDKEKKLNFIEIDKHYAFPKTIKEKISNNTLYSNEIGHSNNPVIFIETNNHENLYLKINNIGNDDQLNLYENKIITYLNYHDKNN